MKRILLAGVFAFSAMPAVAADMPTKAPVAPAPVYVGGFFGEVTGAYDFRDPIKGWQEFGAGSGTNSTKAGLGAGWTSRILAGYRWGVWDVAAAAQYGKFANGDASVVGGSSASLSAKMQAYDAQVGYHMMMFGSTDTRLAFGIRYAKWDNTVDAITNLSTIFHNWSGIGPRAEISTKTPLTPVILLHANAGVGVLFGKLDTSSTGGWICTACNTEHLTSANLDGSLGLGFPLGPTAEFVVGYRAEYWSNVNVAITDNSGIGLNQGGSAALSHGPFISLKIGPSP